MSNDSGAIAIAGQEIEIIKHKEIKLKKDQIENILKFLEDNKFYDMETSEISYGVDGDTWLIETNINGLYKVIERRNPEEGFIFDLGKYLILLSKEEILNI